MTICKLRKPFSVNIRFAPYYPFVWISTVSFEGYTQPSRYDSSYDFTDPPLNQTKIEIANVYINNIVYDSVSTEALCVATEQSFFYDYATQILIVHALHDTRLDSAVFNGEKSAGYCSGISVFYDSNGIEFLPFITEGLTISETADRLVYNKMSFDSNTVNFDNSDNAEGEFDQYADNPTPGSDANILHIADDAVLSGETTLTPLYTGFVTGDEFQEDSYIVNMGDKREQLNVDVVSDLFTSDDHPNIKDDVEGRPIPDGYGDLKGIMAYVTNGAIESGVVTYKYGKSGTSLTTVYVKIGEKWVIKTPTVSDASACTFTLAEADGRASNGRPYDSKVDARLRDIDEPTEMIKDLIYNHIGNRYISEYYNTTQWEAEETYFADIYLYISEPSTLYDVIEEIQNATDYGFRFYIDPDGKYNIKADDIYRAVSMAYDHTDIVHETISVERDFVEYATSIRVNYGRDLSDDTAKYVINTDYSQAAEDLYRLKKELTYESNLKNSTDADTKALLIATDYSEARMKISFILDNIVTQQIYDVVELDTGLYNVRGELIREYYGVKKLKISGIEYDLDLEQTKITGIDITGVV